MNLPMRLNKRHIRLVKITATGPVIIRIMQTGCAHFRLILLALVQLHMISYF